MRRWELGCGLLSNPDHGRERCGKIIIKWQITDHQGDDVLTGALRLSRTRVKRSIKLYSWDLTTMQIYNLNTSSQVLAVYNCISI